MTTHKRREGKGVTVPIGRWRRSAPRVSRVGGGVRHATRGPAGAAAGVSYAAPERAWTAASGREAHGYAAHVSEERAACVSEAWASRAKPDASGVPW